MKVALLLIAPLAILALVRDAMTTQDMDIGLIALGSIMIASAFGVAKRVNQWAERQGPAGMGIGIVVLVVLAGCILAGGLITLQGVHAGR